jgi:tetratricopeptide (TPR) repeat protein
LATIPYVNGLRNGFTFDDVAIVAENQRLRSAAGFGQVFSTDWWNGERPQSLLYRPLTMATFAIDYAVTRLGESNPPPARLADRAALPFHLQNLLWHAAASVALFFLVLELFASPGVAWATAALFAVHPVHTEAVNGIVGCAELMSACFAFLSLLIAWRVVVDDSPGAGRPALAAVFLVLALLSKEQAIVVPAVPLLWLALRLPADRRKLIHRRSFRRLIAALGCAALAYLAVRTAVLGSPFTSVSAAPGSVFVDNPIAGAQGASRLLTPVRVFGDVLRLLVFPKALSADYSYDQIPLVGTLDGTTLLCLLALLGLVAVGFLLRRRAPAAGFGILFFFLAWALTANVVIVIGTILGERLLYLPSAGACLAIAATLLALGRRIRAPWVGLALVSVLVVLGATRTFARNSDWKNNLTIFQSATQASPRSCKAWNAYASELLAAGRPEEALLYARRSLAIAPRYPDAHRTLSKVIRELANAERDASRREELRKDATGHAQEALTLLSPSAGGAGALADAWNVLGGLALDAGHPDEALSDFGKSLERDPGYVPAMVGSGVALSMRGEREAALARFERALALDPGNPEAHRNIDITRRELAGNVEALANLHGARGRQLLESRRFDEALNEFREAAKLEPGAARAYLGIGSVLAAKAEGETDQAKRRALVDDAIGAFQHALTLEPDDPTAHVNLGIMYLGERRDPAKVIEHFRAYLRLVPNDPQRAQMEGTIRQMEANLDQNRN